MNANLESMLPDIQSVAIDCPAKVNLSLAILGPREDGFHSLHSVVAQTDFCDSLTLEWNPETGSSNDKVVVQDALVPEGDNSVLKAIQLFRLASGISTGSYSATLVKRIPIGAGLGGGSSDAVATLKALSLLHPEAASSVDLSVVAAQSGSDCPLFLSEDPVIMEGRGEGISFLPSELASRFRGKPLILFKPPFSVNTAEAYGRLAKYRLYQNSKLVKEQMDQWRRSTDALPPPLNDFQRLMEQWIPSLPIVLTRLRDRFGLDARLSGSGSACFAFSPNNSSVKSLIEEECMRAWGESCWVEETILK